MKKLVAYLHHLFLPKASNNFKAKALHLDFLTFYLLLALIFSVGVKQLKTGAVLGFATDINTQKLFELTNQERAAHNLQPLKYNDKLAAAAEKKAENMFSVGYWAHFAPDGTTPWSFILGQGYQYSVAGENLAKGFYFSNAVVDAWMNSPSHRENMLRESYQDVGYAVVNGTLNGEETTLVVQMFGTPLNAVVENNAPAQPKVQITVAPTLAVKAAPKQAPIKQYYQPPSTVLAKETSQGPKLNFFPILFNTNILFLGILALVLMMDFYFTKRLNIVKVSGKNIAHLFFIGFIFLGIFVISKGGIIQ